MTDEERAKAEIEFENAKRLESIFIPYARQRRDTLYDYGKRPHARFVHYTTGEGGLKIISGKKIWLRNTTCMKDFREVHHGFEILRNFFSNKEKRDSFHRSVNAFAEGASDKALNQFDQVWKTLQFKIHIGCLSEHGDDEDINGRLSMWRGFGNPTETRVAIIFKLPWRSEPPPKIYLRFNPVAYVKHQGSEQMLLDVIKNMDDNREFLRTIPKTAITNWIFYMILCGASCVKHEGFIEEREWRIVYCPEIDKATEHIKLSLETIQGVPQHIYSLPIDGSIGSSTNFTTVFDRLIIGPSQYRSAIGDAFVTALTNAGVQEAEKKVFASNIPILT
jgi:hypothetical protein